MEFSPKLIEALKSYVYALIDPRDNKPFYIGKGEGGRVLAHANEALATEHETDKLDTIRDVHAAGLQVKHVILRHGMDSKTAFVVESALIDFVEHFGGELTNIVAGHHSSVFGVKTIDELARQYEAPPLKSLGDDCVIININRRYDEAKGEQTFYDVTREYWAMANPQKRGLKYALAEYRGFVVEVFETERWYQVKESKRWGFEGVVAPDAIRNLYINRKIYKARGTANPIAYRLQIAPEETKNPAQ